MTEKRGKGHLCGKGPRLHYPTLTGTILGLYSTVCRSVSVYAGNAVHSLAMRLRWSRSIKLHRFFVVAHLIETFHFLRRFYHAQPFTACPSNIGWRRCQGAFIQSFVSLMRKLS